MCSKLYYASIFNFILFLLFLHDGKQNQYIQIYEIAVYLYVSNGSNEKGPVNCQLFATRVMGIVRFLYG